MSYLFSFQGRINRDKIWLFLIPVTIAWEIAILIVALIGLDWTQTFASLVSASAKVTPSQPMDMSNVVWPQAIGPKGMIALVAIALLVLLYVISLLAIYTKRLHDRNKSAWWLLPFVVIPWALQAFVEASGPNILATGMFYGPLGPVRGTVYLIATILGLWAFIELYFFRGTRGENRFGPDPLG